MSLMLETLTISAPPGSYGNHGHVNTAFDGENVGGLFIGALISGPTTLRNPTVGYIHNQECAVAYFPVRLTNTGHNESLTGNGGRTGYATIALDLQHYGNGGDFAGITCHAYVATQRDGALHTLAQNAVCALNGTFVLGTPHAYLNFFEADLQTNGNPGSVACVLNITKDSNDKSQSDFTVGWRVQSHNLPIDAALSVVGPMTAVVESTAATCDDPILIAEDQYLTLDGTNSDGHGSPTGITPGTTKIGKSGGYIVFKYEDVTVAQVNEAVASFPQRVNTATEFAVDNNVVVDESRGIRLRAYSDAEIRNPAHAVNTTDKVEGKKIWNRTRRGICIANGPHPTSGWSFFKPSATINPG